MALKSISTARRRLADEVYEQLVEAILNQDIGRNDRLVQEKLAAQLQISRTPVREALLRLENEGVLVSANKGGFRLATLSERDVRDLYQARAAIEAQAARILAVNCTATELEHLRTLIAKEEGQHKQTTREYFVANRNIHRAFVEMSSNSFLLEMFDMIWGRAMSFNLFSTIENADLLQSLGDHITLVDAIETGDQTHAHDQVIRHIEDGIQLQLTGLRKTQ